ncbi:MAG: hypothetical protein IKH26_09505 [Bacteroidaceae bacterium]|nr:hypothetical protein [Bacteroidaceae bacterium]
MKTLLNRTLMMTALVLVMATLFSCGKGGKKIIHQVKLKAVKKELTQLKKQMPIEVEGTGIIMTDVDLKDDIVVYTAEVKEDIWDEISLDTEVANSDRNYARILSSIPESSVKILTSYDLGLKYIYTSAETQEVLEEIEMSPEKLKEINDKVKSGELQAYTLLELSQMELEKMQFPIQIDEDIWMTTAYIKGHDICYEVTFDYEVDAAYISQADRAEMKDALIEGAREEQLITMYKKEMFNENVHLIYIYKDSRGKECLRFNLSPTDIFGSN